MKDTLPSRAQEARTRPEALESIVTRIFEGAGCGPDEASRIARYLVDSNCTGHDSHGVVRVTRYLKWIREGTLIPNQTPEVLWESESVAAIDGRLGFGQTVAPFAIGRGITKALDQGIALVGVRRSGHLGRIGDWAAMAAEAGLCSIHFVNVNGHVLVAPFRGTDRRMSTAPIAIGLPAGDGAPIILDFATALIAEGKALVALKGGRDVRPDALIHASGAQTGDPSVLYGATPEGEPPNPKNGSGAIRAFGDHKGSGLAFMCEALAGILTGSGTTSGRSGSESRVWSGMMSILFKADTFLPMEMFGDELAQFAGYYAGSPQADPDEAIKVPGEIERERRREAREHGLVVSREILDDINAAAEGFGIDERV